MPSFFREQKTEKDIDPDPPDRRRRGVASGNGNSSSENKTRRNRTSTGRSEVRREFVKATTKGAQDEVYTNPESLPSIGTAYDSFLRSYPAYSQTLEVDDLRDREFFHLEESQHVCMDYCGFGLFSYYQQIVNKAASSFGLAYIAANLATHALHGTAHEGTVEFCIRKRVMDYLNINDTEYSMVFTASRGTAFKLLAESYPFHLNRNLLTVYDFESEAVNWMADCAKHRGAKIISAHFKWPSLRIGTSHLKTLLQGKKTKSESAKGLFVFPVQSRMTGSKYSYQWMSTAQQHNWHVLLDASSLGPKDMDSLGLSLFRPDFIVSSFYKVFGTDPTGFGCLFIKNVAIHCLQSAWQAQSVGLVRIVSLNAFTSGRPEVSDTEDDGQLHFHRRSWRLEQENSLSSFSGPFSQGALPELTENQIKESNHRHWKSWSRRSKLARRKKNLSAHLAGANGLVHGMSGTGEEGDVSQIKMGYQPTKSRHCSEFTTTETEEAPSNERNGTGLRWEARGLYEDSENEIQELEGDSVSEVGDGQWPVKSQWHRQGRTTGFQPEFKAIEFESLAGKRISPIPEVDVEDQEMEERSESDAGSSKVIDDVNGDGGDHMGLPGVYRNGGDDEIDEDTLDLESSFVEDSGQLLAEAADEEALGTTWDSNAVADSQQGSGSDLEDPGGEQIPGSSFTDLQHQDAGTEGSEVGRVKDPSDSVQRGETNNDGMGRYEFSKTSSEPGSPILAKERLHTYENRDSFEQHTGKQLSDFQEMGVGGLVQKFQNLQTGTAFDTKLEGEVEVEVLAEKSQSLDREDSFHSLQSTTTSPSKAEAATGGAIDEKDHGFENGRSDLRSNRTLSRDVDFEDEMYAKEMFESRSTALVEDSARLNIGDSDEDSFIQSEYYSESLDRSRYSMDDLQQGGYEGYELDTDDEFEDILGAELLEDRGDPIITCKGLDFADSLGLTKLNYRTRFLINWLVNSLLKLRHHSNQGIPLIRVYGPKVKFDRGAAVSFNVFDWRGLLIQPDLVQQVADRCNISLGVGRLCNIVDPEMSSDFMAEKERLCGMDGIEEDWASDSPRSGNLDVGKSGDAGEPFTIPVVTAAIGFVTTFEDVYKLWGFLAKFLDADYVSKEAWRYHSLNQQIRVM